MTFLTTLSKFLRHQKNNEFYNLVVHVNNQQQIIKSELYEFIPNSEWLQDVNQPFTGQIKVLDNDIISLDDSFSAKGRAGLCLSGASGEWECNLGNNHAPGEGDSCTSWQYIINLEYGPCDDEPLDYIIAEAPTTITGGSGGTTPNQNTTPIIPTIPCGDSGFADGNGYCYDAEVIDLANQLNNILDDGDFYEIYSNPLPSNVLSFDSVDDFQDFLDDQTFELGPNTTLQDGNTKTEFTIPLTGSITQIKINVISKLKNIATGQPYELLEVNSESSGLWVLTSWNQSDSEMAHSINNITNIVTIQFEGAINYGVKIKGMSIGWSDSRKYVLQVNILTGKAVHIMGLN